MTNQVLWNVILLAVASGIAGLLLLQLRDVIRRLLRDAASVYVVDLIMVVITFAGLGLSTRYNWLFFVFPLFLIAVLFRYRPLQSRERLVQASILLELAAALEYALPLDEFVAALASDYANDTANRLKRVAERLRQGVALSAALKEADLLPEHAVLAIQAGELGGGRPIPNVLRRAADDLRAQSALRSSFMFWIYYSIAMWLICAGLGLFQVVFILPKFQDIFKCMGASQGWRPFLAAVTVAAYTLGGTAICTMVSVRVLSLAPNSRLATWLVRGAHWVQRFLPLLGARMRHRALARAARVLEGMASAGLTLPEMCRAVAVPALAGDYAGSFAVLADKTEAGEALPDALRRTRLPPSFAWFAEAGAAGDFACAMRTAAEYHDARAQRLDRVLAALMPCVALSLGGLLVGSVYITVLSACFRFGTLVTPK